LRLIPEADLKDLYVGMLLIRKRKIRDHERGLKGIGYRFEVEEAPPQNDNP